MVSASARSCACRAKALPDSMASPITAFVRISTAWSRPISSASTVKWPWRIGLRSGGVPKDFAPSRFLRTLNFNRDDSPSQALTLALASTLPMRYNSYKISYKMRRPDNHHDWLSFVFCTSVDSLTKHGWGSMKTSVGTLANIQLLRAIAATLVIFVHMGSLLAPLGVAPFGGRGVDLFFIISGFWSIPQTVEISQRMPLFATASPASCQFTICLRLRSFQLP